MTRSTALVLAALLAAAQAPAQWLETTIDLPQSPEAVCWNPANNRVYCAVGYPDAYGAVVVIDGATNSVLDTLLVGYDMPGGLCPDARNGRVYCAGSSYYPLDDSLVTVIAGDTVAAQVPVGSGPMALALNPGGDRLYVACQLSNRVYVIDLASDTVRAVLPVGSNPVDLVYVPEVNKVYCANRGVYGRADRTVTVIDGERDSVRRAIGVGDFPRALCYNRIDAKLYSANGWSGSVTVIDTRGDTVVATVAAAGQSPFALCRNPANNHVYCADGDEGLLTVIDGATNAVLANIPLAGAAWAVHADSGNNKVYCSNFLNDVVTVIDGASDTILATITVGSGPRAMGANPRHGRVYVANRDGNSLSVIRDSVVGAVAERTTPRASRMTPASTLIRDVLHLPVSSFGIRHSTLVDAAGRRLLDLRPGPNDVSRLAPGVYFIRSASSVVRGASSATKVVVQR
jgi:YVTN family beta-propeller protein